MQHRHDHDADGHHLAFDTPEMAAHAELEGEVLIDMVTEATTVLAELCRRDGVVVRRVLDLGCGPGVGTCCLAEQFDSAHVVAADSAATMLQHVAARAERHGFADRVETRLVELPDGVETLDRADIIWASMALHHVGDETAALRQIRELVEPGGLLAVVERADPMRVLPDDVDLGRPSIWERLDAAWSEWFTEMRADVPGATTSDDYPVMLDRAGFEIVADDVLTLVLDPPLDARARRLAQQHLQGAQTRLEGHADAADLEALVMLTDENAADGIMRRDDALLHATRHLYVAGAAPRA